MLRSPTTPNATEQKEIRTPANADPDSTPASQRRHAHRAAWKPITITARLRLFEA